MRILITQDTAKLAGVPTATLNLAKELIKKGHSVFFVTGPGENVENYKKIGAKVEVKEIIQDIDLGYISFLRSYINKNKIEIISTNMLKSTVNGLIASSLTSVKSVAHIHGSLYEWEVPTYKKYLNIIANTLVTNLFADSVIALTYDVKKTITEKEKIKKNLVHVIYGGVDVEYFTKENQRNFLREKLLLKDDTKIVGFFGRLTVEKGPNFFIEAIPDISSRYESATFVISGTGEMLESLKNKVSEMNLQTKVHFLGAVPEDEKVKVLKSYDIYVFPSIREGFGLGLVEAMACRLPIVSFQNPVIKEVVQDGQSGLLAKNKDVKDLSDKILMLLNSTELSRRLGEQGLKTVSDKFSLIRMADSYEKLYTNLLNKKN